MEMKRFEFKIRKEMIKSSFITVGSMLLLAIVLLGAYTINMRNYRLNVTADSFRTIIPSTIDHNQVDLFISNKETFKNFISNAEEVSDSQLYRLFYTFNSQQIINSELLILNENYLPLLSTNNVYEDNYAFLNYLSIVLNNEKESGYKNKLRIFRTNNETYLLYFFPFFDRQKEVGFGISIINGKEFQILNQDAPTNYIIYDNFYNVLSTNNDQTLMQTGKLNHEFFLSETSNTTFTTLEQDLYSNLKVMSFVSNEGQSAVLISSIILLFILSLIVVLYSIYFSRNISNRIGRSLYFLNNEMQRVKKIPNYHINIQTNDEFEILADDINGMVDDLRKTHEKYLGISKLNHQMEKRKLEAQFHPHFLANTLETIRSAMYVDKKLADELILRMNSLLRYSIDEMITDTKLVEDLEYLKNYLKISKIRFDEFDFELNCEKGLEHISVPKLFLLPLIENSLKYGFKHRRDLKIKIFIYQRNNSIIFRVLDNGNALNKGASTKVCSLLKDDNIKTYHHGLRNTKQRISLLYPQSSFNLFSKLNCTVNEIVVKGVEHV